MRGMATLYVTEQGAKVSRESRHLIISKEHRKLVELPIVDVDQLVVFGRVDLTVPVVDLFLEDGREVVFMSTKGVYKGRLHGPTSGTVATRAAQYAALTDETFCLGLARLLVSGKIANARTLLLRLNRYYAVPEASAAIASLKHYGSQAEQATSLDSLRGTEGAAARAYFEGYRTFISPAFTWKKRIKRPPKDPVNALLSFGYTLLANTTVGVINIAGLDAYGGFYHTEKSGRPALALDLMEEFRHIVVDALVLTMINKRIVTPNDFDLTAGGCFLSKAGLSRFLSQYEKRLGKRIVYPATGDTVSLMRVMELQARLLVSCLPTGVADYHPFRFR